MGRSEVYGICNDRANLRVPLACPGVPCPELAAILRVRLGAESALALRVALQLTGPGAPVGSWPARGTGPRAAGRAPAVADSVVTAATLPLPGSATGPTVVATERGHGRSKQA